MRITRAGEFPAFSEVVPIYNWFYPLVNRRVTDLTDPHDVFKSLSTDGVQSRALYFHIPFCASICSFCTFVRKRPEKSEEVEEYVKALIREVQLKANCESVSRIPVRSIFFGGGTPSILNPDQLARIGAVIREHFDLSELEEFSFEMSSVHAKPEKIAAIRDMGVTHARFGVQTFSAFYRNCFGLSPNVEQIADAAARLRTVFPHASFDMLYGMHGQTEEEFFYDLESAVALLMANVAFYPINNAAVQPRLHEAISAHHRPPTSGRIKFYMNVVLNAFMRANGYLPHNGHEYVQATSDDLAENPVVTDEYSFVYHEHVYGCSAQEVLGFGTNAVSSVNRYVINNDDSIESYVRSVIVDDRIPMTVLEHDRVVDESRGVILRLPYHGVLEKHDVDWSNVDPGVTGRLEELVEAGFVLDLRDRYELTEHGWHWYVNLMYYLCPLSERKAIDAYVARRSRDPGRVMEDTRMFLGLQR